MTAMLTLAATILGYEAGKWAMRRLFEWRPWKRGKLT